VNAPTTSASAAVRRDEEEEENAGADMSCNSTRPPPSRIKRITLRIGLRRDFAAFP
jgi:hypothetical protein